MMMTAPLKPNLFRDLSAVWMKANAPDRPLAAQPGDPRCRSGAIGEEAGDRVEQRIRFVDADGMA